MPTNSMPNSVQWHKTDIAVWPKHSNASALKACKLHQHFKSQKTSWKRPQRTLRSKSSTQEDEELNDLYVNLDSEQSRFQISKAPKFKPFIGQSESRRLMKEFQQKIPVHDGILLIAPLTEAFLQDATEILSETFADAVGYMPLYRGFLKKQVEDYLISHLDIAPKAIVLIAVLLPEKSSSSFTDLPRSSDESTRHSWCDRSDEVEGNPATSSQDKRDAVRNPLQRSSPFDDIPTRVANGIAKSGSETRLFDNNRDQTFNEAGADDDDLATSSADDVYTSFSEDKAKLFRSAMHRIDSGVQAESGSAALSEFSESVESTPPLSPRATSEEEQVATEKSESQKPIENDIARRGTLVGTVELSFSPSTRTPSATLNPPLGESHFVLFQDAAYLCNMAVTDDHQRKGYGTHLLSAAERMVHLAGFRRIFLHVRFKDEPAKALYKKAGYEIEKEDCWLVSLWDDRRKLLSKFIPALKQADPHLAIESQDVTPQLSEF